jgi:hypothetical protein
MADKKFQLRDMVIHKKIEIVGTVVFVDMKHEICRVCVDEDMPVENWGFNEMELFREPIAPNSNQLA